LGESLRRELLSTEPIDTGRVRSIPSPIQIPSNIDPDTGALGPMYSPMVQEQITRPSFLSAFLSNLGPALAGGLKPEPGAPFGTGLPGAFQGIQENNQLNFDNALRRRQQQNAEASLRSTIARQNAETNRITQLTPYEVQSAKTEAESRQNAQAMAADPRFLDALLNGVTQGLGSISPDEGVRLQSARQVMLSNLRQGKPLDTSPYDAAIKQITQDRITKNGEPLAEKIPMLNGALQARWQVLNPGQPLPPYFTLQPGATQKDFDRLDKVLQQTELDQGTKSQRETTNAIRNQTFALTQQQKNEAPVFAFDAKHKAAIQAGYAPTTARSYSHLMAKRAEIIAAQIEIGQNIKAGHLGSQGKAVTQDMLADPEVPYRERLAAANLACRIDGIGVGPSELHLHRHEGNIPPEVAKMLAQRMKELMEQENGEVLEIPAKPEPIEDVPPLLTAPEAELEPAAIEPEEEHARTKREYARGFLQAFPNLRKIDADRLADKELSRQ